MNFKAVAVTALVLLAGPGARAQVGPSIRILDPVPSRGAIFTSEPTVTLQGTAVGMGEIAEVRWEVDGVGDRALVQKGNWSFSTGLRPGANRFRIRGVDQANRLAEAVVNVFYTPKEPVQPEPIDIRTSFYRGRVVSYHVKNGLAIYEGDIILGTAEELERARVSGPGGSRGGLTSSIAGRPFRPQGATVGYATDLWPKVSGVATVPYTISSRTQGVSAAVTNINNAVSQFNSTFSGVIQWVPRVSQTTYVIFDLDPNDHSRTCESSVGVSFSQPQSATGSIDCTVSTLLHEMGHAIGSWHEQSRGDRNSFVNIMTANIDKPQLDNFSQELSDEVDMGLYDYGSVMHYFPQAFSKTGLTTTIESTPVAGITLSNMTGYTSGDVDSFKRMYGSVPTMVTIDTNPSGGQVIVDGSTVTTPHTYNWALNSTHTLNLPADPQTIGGKTYMFGRWSLPSGTTASQSVTATPGSGSLYAPSTSPAVTVYTAHFVTLYQYASSATPSGSGSVAAMPAPTITFAGKNYYVDRQQVSFQANPTAGNSFYAWFNTSLFNLAANPYTIPVMTDMSNLTAAFTTDPVTTIASTALGLPSFGAYPGIAVLVDGSPANTPVNFSLHNGEASWTAGSSHSINAGPQYPNTVTFNISYAYASWSDGLGQTHSINQAAAGHHQTFTATYTPTWRALVNPSPYCGGSISPHQTNVNYSDQNLADGTMLQLTAAAASGFEFEGWGGDATGTASPFQATLHDEFLGTANFNVSGAGAPLSIASTNPSSVVTNAGTQDVTVTGTGFSTSGKFAAFWNGNFRNSTVNSATSATVHLQAGDIATAGYNRLTVQNSANGCSVYVDATFTVNSPNATTPSLTITKMHSGNFVAGQQGVYTVQVSNAAGAGPTNGTTITVTDTLPSGLTIASMNGTNWSCSSNTCTRGDVLQANHSYEPIAVTVNVASNATSPLSNQVSVSGGGSASANTSDSTTISQPNTPALGITKSHTGNFTQGQTGAMYTVTVSNAMGAATTSGTVTVTDTLPSGETLTSMSGTGWNCSSNTCTRSTALAGGTSYPPITVTVNVASNAASPQTNQASVSGGGSAAANTSDPTTINTNQPTLSLSRMVLNFGYSGSTITSPQTVAVNFTGGAGVAWTASSNQSNIMVSPPSGNAAGTFQVTASPGPSGMVTVTAAGATGSPMQIAVNVNSVTPAIPFGSFDTPLNGTTGIAGAVPVTGWVLGNIEILKVDIWREPVTNEAAGGGPNGLVYIGDAVFVADARPDVAGANPTTPYNYRAGWGYLMLTNFLPNAAGTGPLGNGTYKLHAIAHDKPGSMLDLGTRSITVDNVHASKPFGTIDTPTQGGTISGNAFVNFGWALTQNPYCIPTDGSTITVYVDGQPQPGHPTYNNMRSDIATLFPGLCNSNGAIGYYFLNTTLLANGVHTIFWIGYDNQNRGDGLGSRYLNVFNSGTGAAAPADEPVTPVEHVTLRRGFDLAGEVESLAPDERGRYNVEVEEIGRIELKLGAESGHLMVNGERHALPIGSSLKGGVFYWHPGPGFLGRYELEFTRPDGRTVRVRVNIRPKYE